MGADHTVLLIHGMGKPDDKMFGEWEKLLKGVYERCNPGAYPFNDVFNVVPVLYDDVFEDLRKQWAEQIDGIFSQISALPDGCVTKDDLKTVTEDSFFTTHLMDVLLYRFVSPMAERVRARVAKSILEAIVKKTPSGGKVSIIAHSLGTSVVHDALNALANSKIQDPDDPGATLGAIGAAQFHAIIQLANVSRTLETKWDAYEPVVRPGVGAADAVATRMLSASHKWDPLVSLRRFQPAEGWPDVQTSKKGRFTLVESGTIQHWNVHAFEHYVNDPFVHVPMFRHLMTKGFVSEARQTELEQEFLTDNPIAKFDEYRGRLKGLLTGEADFSWKRLVDVFKGFAEAVSDFTK